MLEVNKISHLYQQQVNLDIKKYEIDPLLKRFADLLKYLPKEQGYNDSGEFKRLDLLHHSCSWDRYLLKKELTDAVINLGNQMMESIKHSYELGKEEGKKALIMLNKGEITLNDFENKKPTN
jgi:hypothetical protein